VDVEVDDFVSFVVGLARSMRISSRHVEISEHWCDDELKI
jgi:hypothetical protein